MPRNKDDNPKFVTQSVLADWFGVHPTTIRNYEMRGMPKDVGKLYNVKNCIAWILQEKLGSNSQDLAEARKKLYDAQERKVQLELSKMRGDVVDADEVMQSHMLMATQFSSQLRSLGQRIAGVLQGKSASEIRTVVDDECRTILESVCYAVNVDPGETGGGGDPSAAAEADSRPVGGRTSDTAPRKPGAGPLAIQ